MKVVILSPVMHDSAELVEGDTPDLPQAVAESLIAAGAAIAAGRKTKVVASAEAAAAAQAAAEAEAAAAAERAALEAVAQGAATGALPTV